jgi:hypothetical protein
MFTPQLTPAAKALTNTLRQFPEINNVWGGIPTNVETDWGIGGIMNVEECSGRRKGTMSWGGYPNLLWFIDREAGISGILGTQINPPGDAKVVELATNWMLELQGKFKGKLEHL